MLEDGASPALRIGDRTRMPERCGEMLDVRARGVREPVQPKLFPGGQGALDAVIGTRKTGHADLEPSRVERNPAELAASVVQEG